MDTGIGKKKNSAVLSSTYIVCLGWTKAKPGESLKGLERGSGPVVNESVLSPGFKETSVYESPNKDVLPHFLTPPSFPKNLTGTKTAEDAK